MDPKLQAKHLSRRAVIYVRQSSMSQVHGNLESQRRQYGLSERAVQMGFADVQVIDEDLGRSAGGTEARPGFDRLVSWVCAGEVGAILCVEASRLARNGRDWHHLLDLCALTDTLLIDPEGVYDPRTSNDRLLLGLKGSVSEFELSLLHQRSHEAIKQKAKRGELRFMLPVGLEWTRDGRIVLDPDLRVQEVLRLCFTKFTETGSVRGVLFWFLAHKLQIPFLLRGAEPDQRVGWKTPQYSTVAFILKNPLYAGAYAFGRKEFRTKIVDGRARRSFGHRKPTESWTVLLQEHHPGYISWPEYLRNQQMIQEHAHRIRPAERKAGRGGAALLSGMVRCRRCGRRMQVRYCAASQGRQWSYQCLAANQKQGAPRCLHLGGYRVDEQVCTELLRALAPCAIEAALYAAQQQKQDSAEARHAVQLELEQARYQVSLSARRYEEVDPGNRLVALELERRWEAALVRATAVEKRLDELVQKASVSSQPSPQQLLDLARDLPAVWNAPQADMATKQRLCQLLIQEVLCDLDRDKNEVVLTLHWQGGQHSEVRFSRNFSGHSRRSAPVAARALLSEQGGQIPEDKLAMQLNQRGLFTGAGKPWNSARVRAYLQYHQLGPYASPWPKSAKLTVAEAAQRLELPEHKVRDLLKRGLLPVLPRRLRAGYRIPADALDRAEVRAAAEAIRNDANLRASPTQLPHSSKTLDNRKGGA